MAETILDLSGNVVVADEFRGPVTGDASEVVLPAVSSTSTNSTVGPGTLEEVIVELLDLIEAAAAA